LGALNSAVFEHSGIWHGMPSPRDESLGSLYSAELGFKNIFGIVYMTMMSRSLINKVYRTKKWIFL